MPEVDIADINFLSREVISGVTFQEVLIGFVVVIVVVTIFNHFRRATMLERRERGKKMAMDCPSCGWRGRVIVSQSRCPKCDKALRLR